ncbi:MAG: protein-L-isoaspartate(D-aspartate) O-methyltransferase [Candidatus Omnitrophota bacterium]|nr:protein-L-isoaspartate(D-aspartate) O-methyltransferase [Candidatus Omnitrophota bacterium]
MDFESQRNRMVDEQMIGRGIRNDRVLGAFRKVPRHTFVSDEYRASAYEDFPLPIGNGQTISQPFMVALMTECLAVKEGAKVLEIGTGSGYQAAILAELAGEVYSVERIDVLADRAKETLSALGYKNFTIKVGDGTLGWQEFSPYDGIVVTAGAPKIPENLIGQLKEGGRLVIPVGGSFGQTLVIAERAGGSVKTKEVCGCVFVPLIGKEGWGDRGVKDV